MNGGDAAQCAGGTVCCMVPVLPARLRGGWTVINHIMHHSTVWLRRGWFGTNHNRDSAHWGRFSQKSIAYSKLLFELSRMPTQWSVQARRDTPALAINVNNCNNVFANLVSTGFISSVLRGIYLFEEYQKWINFILESCQIIVISLTSGGQVFQSSASPGKGRVGR